MLKEKLFKFTWFQLKVQGIIGTCPLKCDPNKTPSVSEIDSDAWEYRKIMISMLYVFLLWIQFFKARKNEPLEVRLESILFLMAYSLMCLIHLEVLKRRKSLAELLNLFLEFETTNLHGKHNNSQY